MGRGVTGRARWPSRPKRYQISNEFVIGSRSQLASCELGTADPDSDGDPGPESEFANHGTGTASPGGTNLMSAALATFTAALRLVMTIRLGDLRIRVIASEPCDILQVSSRP